jgi:hypothetical protein
VSSELHCTLKDGFGELLEQAVIAKNIFRSLVVFEQGVNQTYGR